jgi:hypothetical protein
MDGGKLLLKLWSIVNLKSIVLRLPEAIPFLEAPQVLGRLRAILIPQRQAGAPLPTVKERAELPSVRHLDQCAASRSVNARGLA